MPCITSNTTMSVETLDDGSATTYFVTVAAGPVTITFTCDGTIDDISVSPTPPRAVNNTITFSADELNQTFTVSIDYTPSSAESAASGGGPLETPTKQPKFKPVTSCPS